MKVRQRWSPINDSSRARRRGAPICPSRLEFDEAQGLCRYSACRRKDSVRQRRGHRGFVGFARRSRRASCSSRCAGTKADGAAYAADAARRGAAAIVAAKGAQLAAPTVPVHRVDDPRLALALTAARFFGRQPETMVAVTGTSGKTSVASFTRQIWEQDGKAAASIGTTGVVAPGRNEYGALTTPDPVALHRLLARTRRRRRHPRRDGSLEPRARPAPARRRAGSPPAASPISAATTWTIIRRSRTIIAPSCACSTRCCRRARRPSSSPTIRGRRRRSTPRRRAGLDVLTVGRQGDFLTLKRVEHERYRQRAEIEARRRPSRDRPAAGRRFPDLQRAGRGRPGHRHRHAGRQGACGARASEGRARPARPGRHGRQWRAGLCRLCAQARRAGERAGLGAALHDRPRHRGVRLRRRPRPRQAADHGRDRDAARRCRRSSPTTIRAPRFPRRSARRSWPRRPARSRSATAAQAIHEAVAMLHAGDTLIVAGKGHEEGQTIGSETLPFSDHDEVREALRERAA